MDGVTNDILSKTSELKKLLYAREHYTTDEKLTFALKKTRASLIKLETVIEEPNKISLNTSQKKFKLPKVLNTDVMALLQYQIQFNDILSKKIT